MRLQTGPAFRTTSPKSPCLPGGGERSLGIEVLRISPALRSGAHPVLLEEPGEFCPFRGRNHKHTVALLSLQEQLPSNYRTDPLRCDFALVVLPVAIRKPPGDVLNGGRALVRCNQIPDDFEKLRFQVEAAVGDELAMVAAGELLEVGSRWRIFDDAQERDEDLVQ